MFVKLLVATGAAMVVSAVPGHARDRSARADGAAFTGGYVGIEAGARQHRFQLELTEPRFGTTETRTYDATGFGGGAFAGYDLALASRLRLGAEVALVAGGGSPVARVGSRSYREEPQWGYRVGGRLGYVVGNRALVYAAAGFGAERNDFRDGLGVDGADRWSSGVSYGGGVEYRLSRRVGVRLDYREVGGVSRALTLGVPVRF
ncbi:outer membrane beta-barrel protein [Sphingomonas sp. 2R-10]|uniref:outer membrane protein n=1 Tax=Sphingomonas sp. 2R-10 TaxID=3045148 RepID=UPI000F774693|nr:outer membrane beta-barrel protein [Sphingomonas sp. 2R-10]MDJ0277187.1 outer membrane beta-barrel protein [Sphingomonas sp. 2R-10]